MVFSEGDAIGFRITSGHDAPVYMSLLDFGLTGSISQVFPPRNAQDQLGPGVVFEVGTKARKAPTLTWPAGYPFVDSTDRLREAEGIETLKLFVTEQPADFFALEQKGVPVGARQVRARHRHSPRCCAGRSAAAPRVTWR